MSSDFLLKQSKRQEEALENIALARDDQDEVRDGSHAGAAAQDGDISRTMPSVAGRWCMTDGKNTFEYVWRMVQSTVQRGESAPARGSFAARIVNKL